MVLPANVDREDTELWRESTDQPRRDLLELSRTLEFGHVQKSHRRRRSPFDPSSTFDKQFLISNGKSSHFSDKPRRRCDIPASIASKSHRYVVPPLGGVRTTYNLRRPLYAVDARTSTEYLRTNKQTNEVVRNGLIYITLYTITYKPTYVRLTTTK